MTDEQAAAEYFEAVGSVLTERGYVVTRERLFAFQLADTLRKAREHDDPEFYPFMRDRMVACYAEIFDRDELRGIARELRWSLDQRPGNRSANDALGAILEAMR